MALRTTRIVFSKTCCNQCYTSVGRIKKDILYLRITEVCHPSNNINTDNFDKRLTWIFPSFVCLRITFLPFKRKRDQYFPLVTNQLPEKNSFTNTEFHVCNKVFNRRR